MDKRIELLKKMAADLVSRSAYCKEVIDKLDATNDGDLKNKFSAVYENLERIRNDVQLIDRNIIMTMDHFSKDKPAEIKK
ncbi:MAG: hypothetical protein WC755_03480 [Candidatus Woesearchaeota archaeon]|jgi:hypothetical protein